MFESTPPFVKASASLPSPHTTRLNSPLCDEGGGTCACRELRAEFTTNKYLNRPSYEDAYQRRAQFTTVSSDLLSVLRAPVN